MQNQRPIQKLLARADIWQAGTAAKQSQAITTGFNLLDNTLHYGGWPERGLVELLPQTPAYGELKLLSHSLARLSRQPQLMLFIAPPYVPYIAGLQQQDMETSRLVVIQPRKATDILWATEQALRCKACSAVLSWLPERVNYKHLRKLQLAAQQSQSLKVLVRTAANTQQSSPATLRIALQPSANHLQLSILKQPGGWAGQQITLPLDNPLAQRQCSVDQLPVHTARFKNKAAKKTSPPLLNWPEQGSAETVHFKMSTGPSDVYLPLNGRGHETIML